MTLATTADMAARLAPLVAPELDPAYRRRVETVVAWLPPCAHPASHVVDVGCGRGYFVGYYTRLGQRAMTGIERDPVLARRAAQAHAAQAGVVIVHADARALPLADACCTGAILSEVLEHVEDDSAVLREAFRVLHPGGIAAITVPHANYPWCWDPLNRTLDMLGCPPIRRGPLAGIWAGHVRLYDIARLRRVVRDAGFVIEDERALVRHCLPFSHNLLYGIGKPLLESGLLPAPLARSIDRDAAGETRPSRFASALRALIALRDARNRAHEGVDAPTVNLALKARKPG